MGLLTIVTLTASSPGRTSPGSKAESAGPPLPVGPSESRKELAEGQPGAGQVREGREALGHDLPLTPRVSSSCPSSRPRHAQAAPLGSVPRTHHPLEPVGLGHPHHQQDPWPSLSRWQLLSAGRWPFPRDAPPLDQSSPIHRGRRRWAVQRPRPLGRARRQRPVRRTERSAAKAQRSSGSASLWRLGGG
jgi:hypothetical protein